MGLFSRKKKTSPVPAGSIKSASAISLALPQTPPLSPLAARLSLRVAIDPAPLDSEGLFYIFVNPYDDISAIRLAVAEKLGNVSLSLFKVSIPWQAHYQAQAYTERYRLPVDLLANFPAYNIDDPTQLVQSLGPAAWGEDAQAHSRIIDWWPSVASGDQISIVARVVPTSSTSVIPLTFLAHISDSDTSYRTRSASSSPTSSGSSRQPPLVFDISRSQPLSELKSIIAEQYGLALGNMDDVVIWRVEMSEEEMVVIEERGGLKGGKMPWPYPPTAPVPLMLENSLLPISHYFDSNVRSNPRMVSLSIWVNTSLSSSSSRRISEESENAPPFRYPMVLSSPSLSKTPLLPSASPRTPRQHSSPNPTFQSSVLPPTPPSGSSSRTVTPNTFGSSSGNPSSSLTTTGRKSRQRPSTAPAIVAAPSPSDEPSPKPQVHAFGSRSALRPRASVLADTRPRTSSPLTAASITARSINPASSQTHLGPNGQIRPRQLTRNNSCNTDNHGLGITTSTRSNEPHRPSISSIASSSLSSDDESSLPALSMSRLSLTPETEEESGLITPVDEHAEWSVEPQTDELGRLKKSMSLKHSGMWRRGGQGDIGKAMTLNAKIAQY